MTQQLSVITSQRGPYLDPDGMCVLADAPAAAFEALNRAAQAELGVPYIPITEAGRIWARQNYLYQGWIHRLPGFNLANPPGTSSHEDRNSLGMHAIDFGGMFSDPGTIYHDWLLSRGSDFGWIWTGRNFRPQEGWHFEWNGTNPAGDDYEPIHVPTQEEIDDMAANQTAAQIRDYLRDGQPGQGVFSALIYPDGRAVKLNPTQDVNSEIASHAKAYGTPLNSVDYGDDRPWGRYPKQFTPAEWQWFWYAYPGPMSGFIDADFPDNRRPIVSGVPKGQ